MTVSLYTYEMTFEERELAKMDRETARSQIDDPVEFADWEIALQKSWINLVVTDWPKAEKWRIQDGKGTLPYETQEYVYEAAVNQLRNLQAKRKRLIRQLESGKRKPLVKKET